MAWPRGKPLDHAESGHAVRTPISARQEEDAKIVVCPELQAKFGCGGIHSGMIAEATESLTGFDELQEIRWRVLSRLTGNFDMVTLEVEPESLASWDRLRLVVFSVPGFVEAMNAAQEIT